MCGRGLTRAPTDAHVLASPDAKIQVLQGQLPTAGVTDVHVPKRDGTPMHTPVSQGYAPGHIR